MYTTIGAYYSFYMTVFCRDWIGTPDDGPRYAQNM